MSFTLGPDHECKDKLILGAKGPMWFLVYAQNTRRIYAPINILWPSDPFPEPSPSGNARIALRDTDGFSLLSGLLQARVPPQGAATVLDAPMRAVVKPTGRMFSKEVPEIEILLDTVDIVQGCTFCGKFERVGEPCFKRCGSCKTRWYCSPLCQRHDWIMRHKGICPFLKQGRLREVEELEVMGPMSNLVWQFSDMMSALAQDRPASPPTPAWRRGESPAPPDFPVFTPPPSKVATCHSFADGEDEEESEDEEDVEYSNEEDELYSHSEDDEITDKEDTEVRPSGFASTDKRRVALAVETDVRVC